MPSSWGCLPYINAHRIATQSLSLGMTKRMAGMTKRRAGMTKRMAGVTAFFYLSWSECEASHKKAPQFFV
jgi:hypothetical protein